MQKIVVTPLPRYIGGPCCEKTSHITNREDSDLHPTLVDRVADYRRWVRETLHRQRIHGLRTVNPWAMLMGQDQEGPTNTNRSAWAPDGVHLTDSIYGKLAEEISSAISDQINKPGAARERPAGTTPKRRPTGEATLRARG